MPKQTADAWTRDNDHPWRARISTGAYRQGHRTEGVSRLYRMTCDAKWETKDEEEEEDQAREEKANERRTETNHMQTAGLRGRSCLGR